MLKISHFRWLHIYMVLSCIFFLLCFGWKYTFLTLFLTPIYSFFLLIETSPFSLKPNNQSPNLIWASYFIFEYDFSCDFTFLIISNLIFLLYFFVIFSNIFLAVKCILLYWFHHFPRFLPRDILFSLLPSGLPGCAIEMSSCNDIWMYSSFETHNFL